MTKPTRFLRDPLVLFVVLFIGLGFGSFIYWAATAQLAQGISAQGVLVIKDKRRTIQHLEGGIISEINIREGQTVTAGDLMMRLIDAKSQSRLMQVESDMAAHTASIDRLEANMTSAPHVSFARLEALGFDGFDTSALKAAETQLFTDQKAALEGERTLVQAKLDRLAAEMQALDARAQGRRNELATLTDELKVQEQALQNRAGNISRLNDVKRQVAVVQAALSTSDQEKLVLQSSMTEARHELTQVDLSYRARAAESMTQRRTELANLRAERAALLERQNRLRLIAPVNGVVIDLQYPSVGGVVAPGEPILDIVPKDEIWRVDVKFDPKDRDNLSVGLDVNLRFGTLDPINPPELVGRLDRIAPDATFDAQTQTSFYTAEVVVSEDELQKLFDFELSPGIPTEVFLDSGVPRTPMSYFIEPPEVMLRLGLQG